MAVRQPYPITLALAAGATSNRYEAQGQRVVVQTSDQATFECSVDGGPWFLVGLGLGVAVSPMEEFRTVQFRNTSAVATLAATLVVGWYEFQDTRFHLVTGSSIPVSLSTAQITALTTVQLSGPLASITATVVTKELAATTITPTAVNSLATANSIDIAANANRRLLHIYNDSSSGTVWLRDQSATTTMGLPIGPKQERNIADFTGACRIRNNSGGTCDIYVTEVT